MKISIQNTRLIFGLKVKQLRQQKGLSFAELSAMTKISVSYLNEIEKGKKYPKDTKIQALASALLTSVEELKSTRLPKKLQPISDLLHSNFLDELPLDMFGIEPGKVVEIVANAPTRVGAFISAILEISRNFEVHQEHFYFAALRSYQELNLNYFEDLENKADQFIRKYNLASSDQLSAERLYRILEANYGYKINKTKLGNFPELRQFRSVYVPEKKQLFVNSGLTKTQEAFLLGKEIGFNFMAIKNRVYTSTFIKVSGFEQVLNNFKAAYFSGALLMNREGLVADISAFFKSSTWNATSFLQIMNKYNATPEMFLHRLTNLIPRYFGLDQLFFLRFNNEPGMDHFDLTKELHLSRQHHPHGNGIHEHYCRRWITLWLLKDLHKSQEENTYSGPIAGIQRSKFYGTEDEYLCFTLVRPASPTPNRNVSVSIGLLINDKLREEIAFLDDPAIPVRTVNTTCQRCQITDCAERAVPAQVIEDRKKMRAMIHTLNDLTQ